MAKKISFGQISDLALRKRAKDQRASSGSTKWGLNLGKIVTINYEERKATIKILSGADQEFQRVPVPLTFPAAGNRVFLGALPEIGDVCVLGQIAQESSGGETTPVILAWALPGPWMGYDWTPTQPFSPEEYSMNPKDSAFTAGVFTRTRRKLRHMEPGHIVASSGQGSDLVLDESVLLTNRRANEILIRDADQAIVTRSLQQFHTMAGVRIYSGMVQRDATFLPTQMFSDGVYWDTPYQVEYSTKQPLTNSALKSIIDPTYPQGFLSPNDVFNRTDSKGTFTFTNQSGVSFQSNVDPYEFLKRGLFITSLGYLYDNRVASDAVYGGKPTYRVSVNTDEFGKPLNAAVGGDDNAEAFTEYRIEVSHTSDGLLPVTEQTDGFDADRLPDTALTGANFTGSKAPFVTMVYGSVVGNDPFSPAGRAQYGSPLKPVVFSNTGDPAPEMVTGIGSPLADHAASLFQVTPVDKEGSPPTFWSVTKDGRVKASIQGPKSAPYSAEVLLSSGLRLVSGGAVQMEAAGGFQWKISGQDATTNRGLDLSSRGAVRIHAEGVATDGNAAKRLQGTGQAISDPTSLELSGKGKVQITSDKKVEVLTEVISQQSQQHQIQAMTSINMDSADSINVNSTSYNQSVGGKAEYSYYGPKDLLPTNGPHRNTTFSGLGTGTVDKYFMLMGDRKEEFAAGNHSTSIAVGNLTYETAAGVWEARAGTNSLSLNTATGLDASVSLGNIKMAAVAGTTEISGQIAITLKSTGPATLEGQAGVILRAPGKTGGIVSSSDLDPLTGAPLLTYGMGSPGHVLSN